MGLFVVKVTDTMTSHAHSVCGQRPGTRARVAASSHDRMRALAFLAHWGGLMRNTHTHTHFPAVIGVLCSLCHRFQSERESGDRNFAIGYYLKEKKV